MMMRDGPQPPISYQEFVKRFPKLGQAWDLIAQAGKDGPLDEKTCRLVKLAVAIGALRQGAVHSSVRKALAAGIPRESIEQVIALATGTIGLPAAVAVYTWMKDLTDTDAG
jgi:alkylhydroperoxidase/carboxymuconolactone decarboxylase family protein YurZ